MIELKKKFIKSGKLYTQLFKDENIVIYQIKILSINVKYYEVFKYTIHEKDIYHDDLFEVYPNKDDFGDWAFSCTSPLSLISIIKQHFPNVTYKKELFNALCQQ